MIQVWEQAGRDTGTARHRAGLLVLLCLSLCQPLLAAPPAEYRIEYDARYGNWRAESSRELHYDAGNNIYRVSSSSRVKVLGQTLTSIDEQASFLWDGKYPVPVTYHFDKSGIGARERQAQFDYNNDLLHVRIDDDNHRLPLTEPVYDNLSAFQYIRVQLSNGVEDIRYSGLDKDQSKDYRYRVVGEETLRTELGEFATVHLERIRDAGNERSTDIWLARDHDYLLLRLVQTEPNGREIRLTVREAELRGQKLSSL